MTRLPDVTAPAWTRGPAMLAGRDVEAQAVLVFIAACEVSHRTPEDGPGLSHHDRAVLIASWCQQDPRALDEASRMVTDAAAGDRLAGPIAERCNLSAGRVVLAEAGRILTALGL